MELRYLRMDSLTTHEWKIEIAASAYLENTTVNQAEYMGMNEGLRAAQTHGVTDLVVVGNASVTIQQYLGVMTCLKKSLLTQLNIYRVVPIWRIPACHPRIQCFGGLADRRNVGGNGSQNGTTQESKNKLE
ncbi:unnamed protein product [Phytophthora fragariaefolia]|uniref:Unnamed protein product n=1 Tax=Phytophthora fragariaefolia TaxID=1490495 RepID=A0A9W6Y477_9STRA|nr:unnamed protein product [Phytophthora fragariaefolia]